MQKKREKAHSDMQQVGLGPLIITCCPWLSLPLLIGPLHMNYIISAVAQFQIPHNVLYSIYSMHAKAKR